MALLFWSHMHILELQHYQQLKRMKGLLAIGFTIVNFLKWKSKAFVAFCKYKQLVENKTSRTIKVRRDNGGEYVSQEWEKFFNKNGIIHQKTIPYTPQQNGIAKRKNITLFACTMLKMG